MRTNQPLPKAMKNNRSSKQQRNPNMKAVVREMIDSRAEKKDFIFQSTGNLTGLAGTVINCSNNIIQGDNYNNRSGDTIRAKRQKLTVRCAAVTSSSTNRFILFRDNMNTGVTPAVSDVLDVALYVAGYNSLLTRQQHRFTILTDWWLDCNLNGETVKTKSLIVPKGKGNIQYNGPTAIATANGKGAIFLLAIGTSATALYDVVWQCDYTDS